MLVNFNPARERGHRVGFDPDARDPDFLAFDQSRSSSTERVEDPLALFQGKSIQIVRDQMWRKGQHEPVPLMDSAILGLHLVRVFEEAGCLRWNAQKR